MTYWALGDVLGPMVHVSALFNGCTTLLFVIPATVWVPSFQAVSNYNRWVISVQNVQDYIINISVLLSRMAGASF